mgnify:CR=1 FL=1
MENINSESEVIWVEKTYLLIKRFNRKLRHDDLSAYASSIAFFLFLSLIPLLILICFLIPYTPFSEADLMLVCMNLVPKQMNPWIIGLISQVYDKPKGILPVTFFITIWSAGKGMLALMRGLNRINDVMEERGYFRLRLLSSIYTIVILIVLIITFVLGVFGRNILKWLVEKTVGVMEIRSELISLISFFVMISVSIFAFSGIYTYIPNKKLFFYKQIPGAVFVASAWSIFTFGFSLYIEYFSGFTAYGTLGTIVLFLFWLYFCSYIMLMGAVINWFWEKICI